MYLNRVVCMRTICHQAQPWPRIPKAIALVPKIQKDLEKKDKKLNMLKNAKQRKDKA